jgi:hypothetical protein
MIVGALLLVLASGAVGFAASAAVSTPAVLPVGTTQYYVVQSTTYASTTVGTYATMPGLTTSITIPGGKTADVMVLVCGESWAVESASALFVRAKIAGNVATPVDYEFTTSGDIETHCGTFWKLGVGSGTKTVKAEWRSSNPGILVFLDNRSMIVTVNIH